MGYYHTHRCPVCDAVVGPLKCFCDDYSCADDDPEEERPIGEPRRCEEHTRYWIGILVGGVIVVAVGCFVWWLCS